MSETFEDVRPDLISDSEPTPRVSTPLTADQATTLLKLHYTYLEAKVLKYEASEREVAAATDVNKFIQAIPRPDNGAWEVNLKAGTLDPK